MILINPTSPLCLARPFCRLVSSDLMNLLLYQRGTRYSMHAAFSGIAHKALTQHSALSLDHFGNIGIHRTEFIRADIYTPLRNVTIVISNYYTGPRKKHFLFRRALQEPEMESEWTLSCSVSRVFCFVCRSRSVRKRLRPL